MNNHHFPMVFLWFSYMVFQVPMDLCYHQDGPIWSKWLVMLSTTVWPQAVRPGIPCGMKPWGWILLWIIWPFHLASNLVSFNRNARHIYVTRHIPDNYIQILLYIVWLSCDFLGPFRAPHQTVPFPNPPQSTTHWSFSLDDPPKICFFGSPMVI